MSHAGERELLQRAIELSRNAPPSDSAFSVGCVIVAGDGEVIATGFSRERGAQSHAEEVALEKALDVRAKVVDATLYTSIEPCSVRRSGLRSCAARIVESGIKRVVFALREPPLFVEGRGGAVLREAGVSVLELAGDAQSVRAINAHLLK